MADTWRSRAACLTDDPELFFPIDAGQAYGIWGGLTEQKRESLKRRTRPTARAAGRP